jgi:hypothetical protein
LLVGNEADERERRYLQRRGRLPESLDGIEYGRRADR